MTTVKNTRKALLMSAVSLLLCFAMLLGTTFAWFTDSASSGSNVIMSGNLNIEVEYTLDGTTWNNLDGATDLFKKGLWEPGHTEVVILKIKNAGNLALKYSAGMNITNETVGKTENGTDIVLSDILTVSTVTFAEDGIDPLFGFSIAGKTIEEAFKSENAIYYSSAVPFKSGSVLSADKVLLKTGDIHYVAIKVDMAETVGNEANHNGTNKPSIEFGINIYATQHTHENDSFGNQYDKESAVSSIADAMDMIAENKAVTLVGIDASETILQIPADYTQTVTLANCNLKSIQAKKDVSINIIGNVTVNAKNNGSGVAVINDNSTESNGSAISANGAITISGTGSLTAIAADVNGAAGIGGMNVTSIYIEGVTIENAMGSYAFGVGTDTKYYKDAPEGGAGIGSGYNGAEITLNNVKAKNIIGGSKAAGIGARYHTGVTVTIKDSVISYVEGGVSAAGIGGSRISNGATENGTTVNIINSTVTANGGAYGAGIGSGYDTHCQSVQPMCTINITDSTINATGGRYAAGVGTGYHNAALTGEIKNSTVTAVSGEKWYKDSYTLAQDIGFGVTDPAREGSQTTSNLVYNGTEIKIPAVG